MESLELFAGAGGLAIGTAKAGLHHAAVVEWDKNACETMRSNQDRGVPYLCGTTIIQGDVRLIDFRPWAGKVDWVSGGPPCQPFSIGGKHRGFEDPRNMFAEAVRAVREVQPKAFIFENVKGLLRSNFSNYYSYILHQLRYPTLKRRPGEEWAEHLTRLEGRHTSGRGGGLRYNIVYQLLNSADYGVPQRRERVLIVGVRSDLGIHFAFPQPTHEEDSLIHDQWVTGDYWERHQIPKAKRPKPPTRLLSRIDRLNSLWDCPQALAQPWQTVRDAIADLPQIAVGTECPQTPNHYLNPGAKRYKGHDGSPLDLPAKTLKAGDHGVPGGENMLRFDNGQVRYFSVRECARLQTFPDEWIFEGSWTESMRQLGNAVPTRLVEIVAKELRFQIERAESTLAVVERHVRRRRRTKPEAARSSR